MECAFCGGRLSEEEAIRLLALGEDSLLCPECYECYWDAEWQSFDLPEGEPECLRRMTSTPSAT